MLGSISKTSFPIDRAPSPYLEQPGPPLNHVASGAVVGFDRASKLLLSSDQRTQGRQDGITYNQNHIFMFVPTERYPEYWFTPGVVSHIPELVTNSILAPVAACSKTV